MMWKLGKHALPSKVSGFTMKVLIINYEFPPLGGGAGNATYYLARHLSKMGHEIEVLTSAFRGLPKEELLDGFRVFRIPVVRRELESCSVIEMITFIISGLTYCKKAIGVFKPEMIMAFFSIPSGVIAYWIKKKYSLPYVVSLRGGDVPGNESRLIWLHKLLRPLRRNIMQNSVKVVANSQGLKSLSEKADPFPVEIIPNGIDTEYFKPKYHESHCFRFLFVGRFQEQKNLFYLIKQMDLLKEATNTPFELHLVGDGPQKEGLLTFINSLKIRGCVKWHSWCAREKIRSHYQQAECLLNPSHYEGLSNVVLEGMACGLPVIASRVIGNEDVVATGKTGFLFDLNRPEVFQKRMLNFLEHPDLAREFGANGRRLVKEKYSWNKVAEDYMKLFME